MEEKLANGWRRPFTHLLVVPLFVMFLLTMLLLVVLLFVDQGNEDVFKRRSDFAEDGRAEIAAVQFALQLFGGGLAGRQEQVQHGAGRFYADHTFGALQHLFRGALLPWFGLWWQGLVFALLHVGPGRRFLPWTVSALVLGIAFGALAVWTGNLGAPIAAHFTINYLNLRYIVANS